jgi:DNA-binding transcriptional LysR family regulator
MIVSFAKQYPEIELDVCLDERFVDLINEDFDVVLRIGALQDTSLIARRMATCPFVVCASPTYLEKHGTPYIPSNLKNHNVLAYTRNQGIHEWRYKGDDGKIGQVNLSGTFKGDSGDLLCSAAIEGIGIAILPIFYVAEHLATGALQSILSDHVTWPRRDINAVFQPNRFLSTRLRLFIEHLAIACKKLPWEND